MMSAPVTTSCVFMCACVSTFLDVSTVTLEKSLQVYLRGTVKF